MRDIGQLQNLQAPQICTLITKGDEFYRQRTDGLAMRKSLGIGARANRQMAMTSVDDVPAARADRVASTQQSEGKIPMPALRTRSARTPILSGGRIDHDAADTSIGRLWSTVWLGFHSYSRTSGS
jgi:hypothetical protein